MKLSKIGYLLGAILLSGCAEKLPLFNSKISSIDVNGSGKFGPKNVPKISQLLTDPQNPEPENQFLGRLITSENLRGNNGFIDYIFRKGDYGPLDEVYIGFIDETILPNLQPCPAKGLPADLLNSFKLEFSNLRSYAQRKHLLFEDKYLLIRDTIQNSVCVRIPNDIKQNHKIESQFKAGLEANIKAVLKESSENVSADVTTQIENLINSNVTFKGQYVDIQIRQEFLDKLKSLMRRLRDNPITNDNDFIGNYIEYFTADKDLVAVSYSLLEFNIDYNISNITKDTINAIINGIVALDQNAKNKLSGKVYASFNSSNTFTGESHSSKRYLIRYGYDPTFQELRPVDKSKLVILPPKQTELKLTDTVSKTMSDQGIVVASLHLDKNSRYSISGTLILEPMEYGDGFFEGGAGVKCAEIDGSSETLPLQRRNVGEFGVRQFPFDLNPITTNDDGLYTFMGTIANMRWEDINKNLGPMNYKVKFAVSARKL